MGWIDFEKFEKELAKEIEKIKRETEITTVEVVSKVFDLLLKYESEYMLSEERAKKIAEFVNTLYENLNVTEDVKNDLVRIVLQASILSMLSARGTASSVIPDTGKRKME